MRSEVAQRPEEQSSAPELASVVSEARSVAEARRRAGPDRADWWTAALLGGTYIVTSLTMLVLAGWHGWEPLAMLAVAVLAHAAANRVMFESPGGGVVAAEPVLVVGWFVLPLPLVPMMVLGGLLISARIGGRLSLHSALARAVAGWHCLGPVAVLAAFDVEPTLGNLPWVLLAFAVQVAVDVPVAVVRCVSIGMSWRVLPGPLSWGIGVDALLAPIGFAAVLATDASGWALGFAMCPVGLLALLARDRAQHLDKAVAISEAFEAAVEAARHDPVSGIANRRAWNEATARAALRFAANPMGRSVTVVVADVDRLKHINDTFGHDAGDEVIQAAARALAAAAPQGALVARIGGDEFGILVLDRPELSAELLTATVRAAVESQPPVCGVPLSLSVGAAACPPYSDVEEAQNAADVAAMADKLARRAGR